MKMDVKHKVSLLCLMLFAFILILSFIAPSIDFAKADDNVLVVYNLEDYIDEEIFADFEAENPGVTVEYVTFGTNEEAYNELLKSSDCDLVCTSDYMMQKMKDEGLLKSFSIPTSYEEYGSEYVKNILDNELKLSDGEKTYAVGYMWGTMGYLYNTEKAKAEELKNWNGILNEKFSGRVTIKDSIRDSYLMAVAAVNYDELMSLKEKFENGEIDNSTYNAEITYIVNQTDENTVKRAEEWLMEVKGILHSFEVDSGKSDIINGVIDVNFAWSGDAVCSMNEAELYEGVRLEYIIPEEGSNLWFDGFVMPKTADEELAVKFLEFLSRPEIAIANMDYTGYVSCIAGEDVFNRLFEEVEYDEKYEPLPAPAVRAEDKEEGDLKVDLNYFFKTEGDTKDYTVYVKEWNRQLTTQYPDISEINRCAIMQNFDNETLDRINNMWIRVNSITFPTWTIVVIVSVIVIGAGSALIYKFRNNIFIRKRRIRKGYTVIQKSGINEL